MDRPGKSRLTRAGASVAAGLAPAVVALAVSLVVTQRHGLGAWGTVARVQVAAQVFALVAAHGVKELLVTSAAKFPSEAGSVWRILAKRHLGYALVAGLVSTVLFGFSIVGLLTGAWVVLLVSRELLEALVIRRSAFGRAAIGETAAAIVVVAGVVNATGSQTLDRADLVAVLLAGAAVRVIWLASLSWETRGELNSVATRPGGASFAVLSLAGFVQSRGDAIIAAAVLNNASLGTYFIALNAVQTGRAIIAFGLRPHAPALHRLSAQSVKKLATTQAQRWGIFALVLSIAVPIAIASWWDGDARWWWSPLLSRGWRRLNSTTLLLGSESSTCASCRS
jgi:hypothetical protein